MFTVGRSTYFMGGNNLWYEEYQNCINDTCHCVSHDRFTITPITRDEVKRVINKNVVTLSGSEELSLMDKSLETAVAERFHVLDLSVDDVRYWVEINFKFNLDPIPKLREILNGVCDVEIAYTAGNAKFFNNKPTLVCWVNSSDMSVEFEFYTP